MILASNQMKVRRLFWEECLEEGWSIYPLTKLFSKEKKWEAGNVHQKAKNMLYLRRNLDAKIMDGMVLT